MSLFTTKKELDKHVRTTLSKLRTDNEKSLRGVTISRLYYKLGEFSSALQYVSSYLQVKNDSAQAYKLQGECYEKLNKIDKALKSYKQSLHLETKQFDLLKHVCKLIAANEHILSTGDAQFWCDFASAQNCQDESVLNLRLKVMNRGNADPKQVQDVILAEIMARPTDVSLRIRLVKHYLDQNRVADAFRYTHDIEMKQNEFFAQSIDWYNAISSVLAKCNTEQKTKWPFWLLSIMTLERQCFLKLCAAEIMKQQQTLNLTECANLLFEFDQTLSAASSVVLTLCSERELAAQFLHHYRGQLCLHAATFLFKRDRFQQSQNRESTINALTLLLVAYNCGIASNDEPWLRNSNESTKQLIRLWSQEGAFRCSQAGRALLSCIDDDKQNNSVMANIRKICTDWTTSEELVNQLRRLSSNSDWRKNLFRMLFNNRDQAGKSTSSHLLKCTEMDDMNYELPRVSDLDTYEECAQWLRPSSLAQMVYLYIGAANLSDLTCHTFNGLNLSTSNLTHCGAETLNQLDVDTFLYATTIQAKRKLDIERTATESLNKGTNFVKPKILPFANISSMLATEEQANWWLCAYKVCKNISGDDLAEVRQQLQYGIEAVRGVGGPKMDAIICLQLGQIFLKRSQSSSKVVEQGYLEARTLALFKFSLHMIKMQNNRNVESRLFKYANGQDTEIEKQVDNLAEEAITHLASYYFKSSDYEQCIDELSNIPLPSATYFIAKAYRRLEESNQTPKKNQRIYSDKASDYLQQTLTLLDHPNVDQKHPLRGIVNSDIRKFQQRQHSTSFNGTSYGADTSLNESFHNRSRRETAAAALMDDERMDKMEKMITQMMETMTVRFDRMEDKIGLLEDKIGQMEDQINKKNDANVDAVGLEEFIDEELQAQNFMGNSTMFPNYSQQRIHTPNQMIPQILPGVACAQQPIINPYNNQYYNNMYQMNQYQASLMAPQRTPLLMTQQNAYADVSYNAQLTDPRNNLHNLLTQQPTVQSQSASMPSIQASAMTTMPVVQTVPPPQQITPVLPATLSAASTTSEKSQQNVVRTWNASFNNTPIEKGPPVNVVITNSEPLPSLQTTTVTSQPALSVTIPSIHIKNTIASNDAPTVSFTVSPKPPPVVTSAAQPVIDFSKKETPKANPFSATPVLAATDKTKDDKTTKPSPFANFSFGNLTSNATGGTSNIFGSLVKPAEPAVPAPVLSTNINNETSIANTSGTKDEEDEYVPTAEFAPVIALPDLVEVKTGEEEEFVKFEYRAKLLRYVKDSKEWKERGVGNMKVLVNKNDPNKVRLLMRRDQVLKLCCNQFISKDTKFTKLPKLDTALSWYGQDFSENELTTELLAVRFKTAETCTQFHNAILDAQKEMTGDTANGDSLTNPIQPKSSVKETTPQQGFGDQFKPVTGSWNCESCYVSNNASSAKCVACNSPKDKPAAKEAPAPVTKAPAAKVDNGFGDKFKPQPGAWECKLCYISNKAADIYCLACESPKDDTVPKKEPKNLLSSLSSSSTPKFSFGVPASTPIANNNAASTTVPATSASPFSFGAFTAMTTNSVSPAPAFGTTLGQPKAGGFTFGGTGLSTKSPFEVTPIKDASVADVSAKLEQKENFSFVFKPKSPGKLKSPLKVDGVEDVSDDENVEEEENNTYFTPVIPLPDKVEVKTGEEDEEVLYSHRAKLFRFAEGEWKERGLGDVKILRHTSSKKLRVVMRREQILKICLNHVLNDEVEYNVKDDKSWHFIVNDFSEGEVELMQFCLRFKTPEIAQEFRQAVRDALGDSSTSETPNGTADNLTQEEKTKIAQLKLPSGFYSHGADCTGCRGCAPDDFVFDNHPDLNADIIDENALPLTQPIKQFSRTPGRPALTTFGQLSKTSEASRNIFGSANNSSSGQGLFTQLSFTPNTKETTSIFGSSNIFGGNKSVTVIPTATDTPKNVTPADEVKNNFSFTNSMKPSVFGQNIFGQATAAPALNATFGTTSTIESSGAAKSFSFGEALRTTPTNAPSTTTPATSLFSFAKPGNGEVAATTTNSTSGEQTIFGSAAKGTSLFGSSLNSTANFGATKFSFASPSTSNNNADSSLPLRDNGLSFAALAKTNDSATVTSTSNTESPFKIDSSLSFASLASQSTQSFNTSATQGDSKSGFFGLSNENAFSNFQSPATAANDSKDDNNVDDANYDPHYDPIIPLPDEIVVRTGEEDEEKLFGERAKLFRYDAVNKEWKERGVGEFKILYHPANDSYRFLLRREQIFKCVLNHQLSADLSVSPMKSSEKAFVWAAHNHGEDSNGELEQLSVRFKNGELATKFINVVDACIGKLKAKGDGLEPEDD